MEVDGFLTNTNERQAHRYHRIDWGAQNMPITRSDLSWLATSYRDNEKDYPIVQFMVSQALGRVAGFWDEHNDFQIVLLDPLHNLQPSKKYAYKVDPCSPIVCQYSSLKASLNDARAANCLDGECPTNRVVSEIADQTAPFNALLVSLSDDELRDVNDCLDQGYAESYADIFIDGVYKKLEEAENNTPVSDKTHR